MSGTRSVPGAAAGWGLAAVLLLVLPGCERLPTGPAAAAGGLRAVTLADWSADGLGSPDADAALDFVAATGANTVVLVVTAYASDARASGVRVDAARTPSPGAVRHAVAYARSLGLAVVLKPHVDLDDGAWRGTLSPADAGAWFASYRGFLLPWAALADSIGSPLFVIGTELAGTVEHGPEWRALIHDLRALGRTPLTYAASWDEVDRVPFWPALDRVGVDAYFPLTQRPDAGRMDMLAGWQPWLASLRALSRKANRPLVLTELGYRSVSGAGMDPSRFASGGTPDVGEQADLYWAALEATSHESTISGLCWWNCLATAGGGPADTDYTPVGKPAAAVLATAWGE